MRQQGTDAASSTSDGSRHPRAGLAQPRPARRRLLALCAAGGLLVALSGCTGDPEDTALTVAQANLTAKEKARDAAAAANAAAEAEFCSASSTYLTALDRYGDVLNATAPTVGDVKDAGKDLTRPRQETLDAGNAAVSAHEALVAAEQEVADAATALAAVEASAAGDAPPEPDASAESDAELDSNGSEPPATIARVQQAEAEFATAQAGITDQTPLVQAAAQFNSAAVALEMAWLALFADYGCLTDEQQEQAADSVTKYVSALQQDLADAGFFDGEVDGVYGPETVAAVTALQKANGLPQTGTVDKATEAALRTALAAEGGVTAQQETASTAAVQQTLKLAGYWDGPVDGKWTDELTEALEALQSDLGVPVTGTVDAATIAALEEAIAGAQPGPSPGPTSESPKPTEAPPSPSSS